MGGGGGWLGLLQQSYIYNSSDFTNTGSSCWGEIYCRFGYLWQQEFGVLKIPSNLNYPNLDYPYPRYPNLKAQQTQRLKYKTGTTCSVCACAVYNFVQLCSLALPLAMARQSTVSDIAKIMQFTCEMVDMGMKKQTKVMKVGDDQRLHCRPGCVALQVWFRAWLTVAYINFSYPNFSLIQTPGLRELAKGVRIIEVGLYYICH